MKTLEELEEEYQEYMIPDTYGTTKEEIINYIENRIKEEITLFNKESLNNEIVNDYYEKTISYTKYLESLIELVNDNNIYEVSKLIDFLSYYYQKELLYIERNNSDFYDSYPSIIYGETNFIAEKNDFKQFIDSKITSLRKEKSVEKKLKI